MKRLRIPATLAVATLVAAGCRTEAPLPDGRAIVRMMHERYVDVRPASLAFVQQTVLHRTADTPPDTTTWYEAAVPGKLRIDFSPLEEGNGALFADGRLVAMKAGRVAAVRSEVNPLQLLLMDVFQFEPARTVEMLDTLGFDLARVREAEWTGVPVWVVGAEDGDLESSQFWVDRDRLVVVRVIQPVGGRTTTWDVQVTGSRDGGGYPQEDVLVMYLDGRLYQEEYYGEIRADIDLDPALFDTTDWVVTEPYWE